MRHSRADELALRRQLLGVEASAQRLRLQRDAGRLMAAISPAALALRAWQGLRARPALAWLPLAGLVALRLAGGRGPIAKALLWWRGWQALRRWLKR